MNLERREQIIEMISQNRTVKNADLMDRFNISIETVRRDLAYLEKQGRLKRVYGGAVSVSQLGVEPEYTRREQDQYIEKKLIAMEASKLIQPHDVVFFDYGTTVPMMAQFIKKDCPITVFTTSLRMAISLSENPLWDIFLPGGQLQSQELALSGFLANQNMLNFNIDKAFIGVGGITEEGITDYHMAGCSLRRQIIQNARQVIALTDATKFGKRALNRVCDISEVDVLITDDNTPQDTLLQIKKAGVQVIQAKEKSK